MAKKPIRGQRQPRALEDLSIRPYFRASMQAELQKFGYKEEMRQLMFGEDNSLQQIEETETLGLDLSVSEDKALHAIQRLLDKTDYQGNIPGQLVRSDGYQFDGYLPKLSLTYSDFYEAYGLSKNKGQYKGRQAQEALHALKSLADTRRICYRRRRSTGKGKASRMVYDVIRVHKPLISITEGFKGLKEAEADQINAGQDLPLLRKTRLVIEVSPILVDQIDTFFLLKPTALHNEIQALLPGKRVSRTISLFIEWLLTLNMQYFKISKANLAEKLRMDSLIQQRKSSLIDKRIQEAIEMAKELEYLLDYKEEPIGLLVFTLNPKRCRKIKAKKQEAR